MRFKRTVLTGTNINQNQKSRKRQYLDNLPNPSFRRVNKVVVEPFANTVHMTSYTDFFNPDVEIENFNFMIERRNFFDQRVSKKESTITLERLKIKL